MNLIKTDIFSFLKTKLLVEVNSIIKKAPNNYETGGVGFVGYDLSDDSQSYKLLLYFDAEKDSLILEYEDLNDIVNYCEIKLCLEKIEIDPVVYDTLKRKAVSDWEEFHRTLSKKDFFKPMNNISAQIELKDKTGAVVKTFTTYKEINPVFNIPMEITSIKDFLVFLYHDYFVFTYKEEEYYLSSTETDVINNITKVVYSVPYSTNIVFH